MDASKDQNKLSRRNFLKGSAVTLAAGGVLTACKPKTVVTEEGAGAVTGTGAAMTATEKIPQAYLNPQDYD